MLETKDQQGFSLLELILVITVMAIIGAVIVPQFGTIATKARLTADITSLKTIQQQLDIYHLDTGKMPVGSTTHNIGINEGAIEALCNHNYLDERYLDENKFVLQTESAACKYDSTVEHYVLVVPEAIYNQLQTEDSNKDTWVMKENTHSLTIN